MSRPTFSLCHATARLPDGWRAAYEAWRNNCDDWSRVEYILGIDERDLHKTDGTISHHSGNFAVEINQGPSTPVAAWNLTGQRSEGQFLITAADDMFPPPHWDTLLLAACPSLDGEYMLEVKSGTSPADDEWMRCQLHSFITRPYYERIGNFFYPGYVGYYADVDATEMARAHGVMVDARHLTFQHRHWIGTNVARDEVYARQDSDANRELGMRLLGERRERNFAGGNRP